MTMPSETAPLDRVAQSYGWPSPEAIFEPKGAGPARHAHLLRLKLETSLRRRPDATRVRVGLLTRDPSADATEDPVAVVCFFPSTPLSNTLAEAHRLAWSFSRARVLLIVEPGLLRVWTCCEAPRRSTAKCPFPSEIIPLPINEPIPSAAAHVAHSLEWVHFASGALIEAVPDRFRNNGRADRTLLENLRIVRRELLKEDVSRASLKEDVAHDLLARIIFVQFLFHRKDSTGRPALGQQELAHLFADGSLSRQYNSLGDILRNYDDAYSLFRWLDDRFNGDLFPGKRHSKKVATPQPPDQAWKDEMDQVRREHLSLLADLVDGRLKLKKGRGQLHLWPIYAFDAIPLDFISSIYEEFVGEGDGVHYTPHNLVDFVLDEVLPWNGEVWDIKILDPACGSGIFLVKAFQRLVHRWRIKNPGIAPKADFLRGLLERNLFGIDKDDNAVRVASLSLYLAMCDEIDPRYYWKKMRLPCLYGSRLVHSDFFEDRSGFDTNSDLDRGSYDLVVGNAPWGEETVTNVAEEWSALRDWHAPNRSIGPLFLVKGAALARPGGFVAMLQPAGALLYNRSKTASSLRRRLFEEYEVEEIVDFSSLRRDTFEHSIAPTCAVVLQPDKPDESTVLFARARGKAGARVHDVISIEATDVHYLEKYEAANDPWVWTVLWHGTRRDLELVHRLAKRPKVGSLGKIRMGIVRGTNPELRRKEPTILRRKMLEQPTFPPSAFLVLDVTELAENTDPYVTAKDSKNLGAFAAPQILFKMSWTSADRRFRAVAVDTHGESDGALCVQSFISIHVDETSRHLFESACLTLNSSLAVYFLFLTGSRFADFIPSVLNKELHSVPLAGPWLRDLRDVKSFAEVDHEVFRLFGLGETDRILVEDFIERLSPDFESRLPDLATYCAHLVRALEESGLVSTAVALEHAGDLDFPLAVVVLYLRKLPGDRVSTEVVTSGDLRERLASLDQRFLRQVGEGAGGIMYHRVARIYDVVLVEGRRVPVVFFVKPNRRTYWSRSSALEDVDALVADALVSFDDVEGLNA